MEKMNLICPFCKGAGKVRGSVDIALALGGGPTVFGKHSGGALVTCLRCKGQGLWQPPTRWQKVPNWLSAGAFGEG